MAIEIARLNEISGAIIGAAINVHRELGPGLLESAYGICLQHELRLSQLSAERELALAVTYRGLRVEHAYRLDLLVERCVVVELKAVEHLHPVHKVQLLTYLRLGGYPLGLLINFHAMPLWKGVTRMANADLRG